jgi:nucleoside-triphosphatase
MNIFLTGQKGVGKSTIVGRVLEDFISLSGGFLTWYSGDRKAPDRCLYISDLNKKTARVAVRFQDNRPKPDASAFDEFGVELIRAGGRFIIMDELGKFEAGCQRFREAVRGALDSQSPVLGVLQLNAQSWLQELSSRPDTEIIQVTKDNRDLLARELLERFHKTLD